MGGPGSGRYSWGGRTTVEACRSIDVNRLNRAGCLRPGWRGGWKWTNAEGERTAWIQLRMEDTRLVLLYRYRQVEGDWRDIEQPTPITWSPCRYGGQRPYFVCPGVVNGVSCNRRTIKLYADGPYFLCRNCYGLAYQSQRENPRDRLLSKAQGIRLKLGGSANISLPFPPKPKGMWQRTYERHQATACALEAAMWAATAEWLDSLS